MKLFWKRKEYFDDFENVNLHLQDYMYNDWKNKYDGIFVIRHTFKFHDYDNKKYFKRN